MKKFEVTFRIIPNSFLGILTMTENQMIVSAYSEGLAKNQVKQMFPGQNVQILSCKEVKQH